MIDALVLAFVLRCAFATNREHVILDVTCTSSGSTGRSARRGLPFCSRTSIAGLHRSAWFGMSTDVRVLPNRDTKDAVELVIMRPTTPRD